MNKPVIGLLAGMILALSAHAGGSEEQLGREALAYERACQKTDLTFEFLRIALARELRRTEEAIVQSEQKDRQYDRIEGQIQADRLQDSLDRIEGDLEGLSLSLTKAKRVW
jgi:hypothetical protein